MTDQDINKVMQAFQKVMKKQQNEKNAADAAKNKKAGKEFLEQNKKKDGVVELPDGLQYKVLKKGTGASPKATDKVKVNYTGTLINGKEFDSSYKRGQPAEFPLNNVIPGWTEALQMMKVGGKWKLFIPSDLAYGDQGRGSVIPPGATLIFEVELLDIVK
jgi:FKBP-type peptidyl-prolyl cis-trans isomerase FklB